ncbi:MAG TPA: dienelactone hydrolase family protein [Burkholderiales bacterium]|nr:dienelactone hydrolase family protein [Burkholderiales bacterium]
MSRPNDPPPTVVEVSIASDGRQVRGELRVPEHPRGAVAFAHGSGSGRYSPRNRFVAQELRKLSLATLLVDLLEEDEAKDQDKVFDVGLLAARLLAAARWLRAQALTAALPLGYFGASTGAAAALWAAAETPKLVAAVVSRGGRPDLAAGALARVKAPALLIVGEKDEQVLEWNRDALKRLAGVKELVVIPGATHLFAEAGTLEEVARHAGRWFTRYLGGESRE